MCIGFDLDNLRCNADCGVRLGEGKVPSPRALSTLSTRSSKARDLAPCLFYIEYTEQIKFLLCVAETNDDHKIEYEIKRLKRG